MTGPLYPTATATGVHAGHFRQHAVGWWDMEGGMKENGSLALDCLQYSGHRSSWQILSRQPNRDFESPLGSRNGGSPTWSLSKPFPLTHSEGGTTGVPTA